MWPLVEFSFHTVLGVDLEDVWHVKSFRWFKARVNGLLSTETPLWRHFQTFEEEPVSDDE